jgi:predicted  nucleic acid-binding Zn-ribbon protein
MIIYSTDNLKKYLPKNTDTTLDEKNMMLMRELSLQNYFINEPNLKSAPSFADVPSTNDLRSVPSLTNVPLHEHDLRSGPLLTNALPHEHDLRSGPLLTNALPHEHDLRSVPSLTNAPLHDPNHSSISFAYIPSIEKMMTEVSQTYNGNETNKKEKQENEDDPDRTKFYDMEDSSQELPKTSENIGEKQTSHQKTLREVQEIPHTDKKPKIKLNLVKILNKDTTNMNPIKIPNKNTTTNTKYMNTRHLKSASQVAAATGAIQSARIATYDSYSSNNQTSPHKSSSVLPSPKSSFINIIQQLRNKTQNIKEEHHKIPSSPRVVNPVSNISKTCTDMNRFIDSMEKTFHAQQSSINSYKKEKEALLQKIDNLNNLNSCMQENLKISQKNADIQTSLVTESEQKNLDLSNNLAKQRTNNRSLEEELRKSCKNYKDAAESWDLEKEQYEEYISALESKMQNLTEYISALESKIQNLTVEYEHLCEKLKDIEEKSSQSDQNKQYEKYINSLELEIKKITQENKDLHKKLKDVEEKSSQSETKTISYENDLEQNKEKLNTYENNRQNHIDFSFSPRENISNFKMKNSSEMKNENVENIKKENNLIDANSFQNQIDILTKKLSLLENTTNHMKGNYTVQSPSSEKCMTGHEDIESKLILPGKHPKGKKSEISEKDQTNSVLKVYLVVETLKDNIQLK